MLAAPGLGLLEPVQPNEAKSCWLQLGLGAVSTAVETHLQLQQC
jgi:hypothetical protein